MTETSTTLAIASTATSVGLALYALKLRAEIAASASGKQTGKTLKRNGDKLWTAEELIAERRSIFPPDFDGERLVPREVLNKMLVSANWAPTHGKTEPWRFVVFESPEKRLEVGQLMADWYKNNFSADQFLESQYERIIYYNTVSSYLIAICMKRQKSGKIPEWEEMCSVACAVQNMHLVATAHGVGAYWGSSPITMAPEITNLLNLGEDDKCLGFFYVGVPKEDAKIPKGVRKPIEDKVTWM
ncbi:Hypothetical protein PHPALM_17029 [Phytophthora palmivora]|uniref:Nitroreductase domain-containing protein n=1 Tax=Phytophthora palmivora TaxID=4796 RepID=A0A2P4XNA2_9STRA|nr:Hypothetical protein PHPALM_17029 [Phytophthora palmivora]